MTSRDKVLASGEKNNRYFWKTYHASLLISVLPEAKR